MQSKEAKIRAARLLRIISDSGSIDFAGAGLIIYRDIRALAHIALRDNSLDAEFKNSVGEQAVANAIKNIANINSPWHDGFLFIRSDDFELTHIAQYVSPPIPRGIKFTASGFGARRMTAVLSSLVTGIELTVVLSRHGEVMVFERGEKLEIEEIKRWLR